MKTFSLRKRTRFGTWNIRTLLKTTSVEQLTREFQRYNLQILGLCETRWKGSGQQNMNTGETLLYSGKPDDGSSGVGIMLSNVVKKCLDDWKAISDRIIVARFKTRARHLTFIQVYAPTEQASPDEKEAFYMQLDKTCRDVKVGDIKILSGDLNAKVGSDNKDWEKVMGNHGIGKMNENGELYADFCMNHDLVIGGTLFQHRNIHKVTWISPDRKTKNQIDHIAISKKWRGSLLDVRNCRGADVYSDHHLLVGEIRIKLATAKQNKTPTERKYNVAKLAEDETMTKYRQALNTKLAGYTDVDRLVASHWDFITLTFKEINTSVLGLRSPGRKEWISEKTWELIEKRKKLKGDMNRRTTRGLLEEYRVTDKLISKNARTDKRKWMANIARDAERAANHCQTRESYRLIKKLSGSKPFPDHPLRDKQGNLLTMDDKKLNRWSDYFEELLNKPPPISSHSPSTPKPPTKIDESPPETNEIKEAIKLLKNGKAPGSDNIHPEMLKADIDLISSILQPLLAEIWTTEQIPPKWKQGLIIKIPKKGDPSQCSNWRGITLLNTINKIVAIIIQRRVSNALDPVLRKEQAGFRPSRSCVDHINTLRIIIEQSVELRSPLYLLFVDFERAFDTLDHNRMWTTLENYGIPTKILNIIQELYRDVTCRVVHNGECGRKINVGAGVKQGCILSPLLFTIVIDWVMKQVTKTPRGIPWTLSERLEDLDFADDICLLTQRESDMREKLRLLVHYGAQVGLKINVAKTKLMRFDPQSKQPPSHLSLESTNIEEVDEFCYLGSIIAKDGGADSDVMSRIKKARQSFGSLNSVWRSTQISRHLKLKLFKSNVLSVLLYGSETWKVTATSTQKLQVFVNKCLRRILKIRWPETIRNTDLHKKCKIDELQKLIKRRKWSWIGHTLRRGNGEIAKQALDWNPQGTRKRGRPRRTWRRSVLEEAEKGGRQWSEVKALARNKEQWRSFCDALCAR